MAETTILNGALMDMSAADGARAFFFDIDGTLLEIAPTPSGVRVDAGLVASIRQLHECSGGAVALISGRRVADVDALFPGLRLPIAGQHGLERRDSAGGCHSHAPEGVDWPRLKALVKGTFDGVRDLVLEDKGLTLAVHYRQNPSLERQVTDALARIVADAGAMVRLQPGKCVLEVKPAGRDKGTAIAEFMSEAPFRGRRPVFLGDDITDEYGFSVVNDLGGDSIKVGEGPSIARWRLDNVLAVRAWLDELLARIPACRRQERGWAT
ncbi:MAG: trehalose-phosphatase [Burkholderiales bacterium]|nr:Trehalose-6-phosphate phosphatase [Rhodocyclaceae bacterium]MCZ2419713.1 trehalose-phosphatase [Burkholderiales bacterium]HNQ56684.1 trehalose-phosphatase [Candidatus Desulfobacillus denitrificans]HNT63227.1 trehalose-phosphatase [Candidatus Desulfobacillus denitrificans]